MVTSSTTSLSTEALERSLTRSSQRAGVLDHRVKCSPPCACSAFARAEGLVNPVRWLFVTWSGSPQPHHHTGLSVAPHARSCPLSCSLPHVLAHVHWWSAELISTTSPRKSPPCFGLRAAVPPKLLRAEFCSCTPLSAAAIAAWRRASWSTDTSRLRRACTDQPVSTSGGAIRCPGAAPLPSVAIAAMLLTVRTFVHHILSPVDPGDGFASFSPTAALPGHGILHH